MKAANARQAAVPTPAWTSGSPLCHSPLPGPEGNSPMLGPRGAAEKTPTGKNRVHGADEQAPRPRGLCSGCVGGSRTGWWENNPREDPSVAGAIVLKGPGVRDASLSSLCACVWDLVSSSHEDTVTLGRPHRLCEVHRRAQVHLGPWAPPHSQVGRRHSATAVWLPAATRTGPVLPRRPGTTVRAGSLASPALPPPRGDGGGGAFAQGGRSPPHPTPTQTSLSPTFCLNGVGVLGGTRPPAGVCPCDRLLFGSRGTREAGGPLEGPGPAPTP